MGLIIPHPLLSPQHSSKLPATVRGAGCSEPPLCGTGPGYLAYLVSCYLQICPARPSCFYTPLLAVADIFYGYLKQVRGGGIEVVEEKETTLGTDAFFLPLPHTALV